MCKEMIRTFPTFAVLDTSRYVDVMLDRITEVFC